MYYVYIIETDDGTYYTGQTNDISRRFTEHLSGKSNSAAYFKSRKPQFVVYIEECETRGDAIRREQKIKRNPRLKYELIGPRHLLQDYIDEE